MEPADATSPPASISAAVTPAGEPPQPTPALAPAAAPGDLQGLRNALDRALLGKPRLAEWSAASAMSERLDEVRRAFNRADAGLTPRTVARTLLAFRLSRNLPNFQALRAACHGLARESDWGGRRLIEESQLFERLLQTVDRWQDQPYRYRKCYRGLLASYFAYPVLGKNSVREGRANWEKLRAYLLDRLPLATALSPLPPWLDALNTFPEVLRDGCAARLAFDFNSRQELAGELGIGEESWWFDLSDALPVVG